MIGLIRDTLYERALRQQPLVPWFQSTPLAYLLLAMGNTLVLSSYYRLGLTGTFLGDYFGILMDEPVTGFPFNVTGAPMYWGSTMSFLGSAILYGRPAGAILTGLVFVVYWCALQFEEYVPACVLLWRMTDPLEKSIHRGNLRQKGSGGEAGGKSQMSSSKMSTMRINRRTHQLLDD